MAQMFIIPLFLLVCALGAATFSETVDLAMVQERFVRNHSQMKRMRLMRTEKHGTAVIARDDLHVHGQDDDNVSIAHQGLEEDNVSIAHQSLEEEDFSLFKRLVKSDVVRTSHGQRDGNPMAIPAVVYTSTYLAKDCIAPMVAKNMMVDVNDLRITDDEDNLMFLNKFFSQAVVDAYHRMKIGAHKADLYRYAKLYIEGGIWLDIKTLMRTSPVNLFKSGSSEFTWYVGLTTKRNQTRRDANRTTVYNGMIATPPNNPILLRQIAAIVAESPPSKYMTYIRRFSEELRRVTGTSHLEVGTYHLGNQQIVFFEESFDNWKANLQKECTITKQPDRYGVCSNIYDDAGRLLATTRHPDYPKGPEWTRCLVPNSAGSLIQEGESSYASELHAE